VQFSDATPAALGGAHDIARSNANDIALEMFGSGVLDVIGGTGNPDYDDNGRLRTSANYQWIGADLWNSLKADTYRSQDAQTWNLLQDRASIQAAGVGAPTSERLAMITQAFTSGNFNRDGAAPANTTEIPFSVPRLTNTPTLSELSLAALNKLGTDPDGLYLMVEGGAVDRAMHADNQGRMIEEYIDFNNAVKSVVDWVNRADTAATFDDTLLVVTADHDHLLFGPEAATIPYQPVQPDRNGDGVPEGLFFSTNHSNQIIPLFTAGAGSAQITQLADQSDSFTNAQGQVVGSGRMFTDQAELGDYLLAQARLGATSLTAGADNLVGTETGDSFDGLAGNDVIDGRDGNDVLAGGEGNDVAAGGIGNDLVYGNLGADVIYGNQGADLVYAGQGNDSVFGGQDGDRLFGNLGNDRLVGNLGADAIYGNAGDDLIYGNQDTDVLFGGQGNDTLFGGQGNDLLAGGLGNDLLVGGIGADLYVFEAQSGRDLVTGFSQAAGDRIRLSGQSYIVGSNQTGDATLTLSGGGIVDLAGIRAAQVDQSYFIA
jgi:Ca2+-binding RTX toxin-like protein